MSFQAFRENGAPTYYDSLKTPWQADMVTSGLIFSFVLLASCFYVLLIGVQGKQKLFSFIRITTSLFIGGVILVTNFSYTWETAETTTKTKYKAGNPHDVNVTIGLNIGLRGINITLKEIKKEQLPGEIINYNEHFSWIGTQGRIGFGPFAGRFNREYREAQFRGLPLPILWVAEYFTFDGEGIRWGRFYRQAGWFAHIMLWLAFPLWLLANIFFCVLLRFGSYWLGLTGLSMIITNIIWALHRNLNELDIPFTGKDRLKTTYGGSFWMCLITGIVCVVLAVVVFVMDKRFPAIIAAFFDVDVLQDSEKIQVEDNEMDTVVSDKGPKKRLNVDGDGDEPTSTRHVSLDITGHPKFEEDEESSDDDLYRPPSPIQHRQPAAEAPPLPSAQASAKRRALPPVPALKNRFFKTSENRMTKKFQSPRRREAPPIPPADMDDVYQNTNFGNGSKGPELPMRRMN